MHKDGAFFNQFPGIVRCFYIYVTALHINTRLWIGPDVMVPIAGGHVDLLCCQVESGIGRVLFKLGLPLASFLFPLFQPLLAQIDFSSGGKQLLVVGQLAVLRFGVRIECLVLLVQIHIIGTGQQIGNIQVGS